MDIFFNEFAQIIYKKNRTITQEGKNIFEEDDEQFINTIVS